MSAAISSPPTSCFPSSTGGASSVRGAVPLADCVARAIADFRPSAHVERLEFMDMLAVKECTDTRFLPERFRKLSLAQVNARIEQLKTAIGE